MNRSLALVFMLLASLTLNGQVKLFSIDERQKQLFQLSWMVGEWEGSGWIDRGEEGRSEVSYTQAVRSKQNGLFLVLDGEVRRRGDLASECSVLRLLSYPFGAEYIKWQEYSSENGTERMNEARVSGRSVQVGIPPINEELTRVGAGTFRKDLPVSIEGWVRITISLNNKNEWIETWEMRRLSDTGDDWFRFFEVALSRKAD